LSLARAVMNEPRFLLLDEPSSGLDARSTERLAEAVKAERERGAIAVLVTHDAALVERVADRRVRLERGRVQEAA
jgi:ABC-type sulfate/molybdate transport systems ATPase subunit